MISDSLQIQETAQHQYIPFYLQPSLYLEVLHLFFRRTFHFSGYMDKLFSSLIPSSKYRQSQKMNFSLQFYFTIIHPLTVLISSNSQQNTQISWQKFSLIKIYFDWTIDVVLPLTLWHPIPINTWLFGGERPRQKYTLHL